MNNQHHPSKDDHKDKMPVELDAALRILGYGMPKTEAEVAAAEAWLSGQEMILPESIRDSSAILRRGGGPSLPLRPINQDGTTCVNLARAAREGGTINEDIEARMRADREEAERDGKPC